MTMTCQRLLEAQNALQMRGVVDVKFYFERGQLTSLPKSEVGDLVAGFLECYLEKSNVEVEKING